MKHFATIIKAVDSTDDRVKRWTGPRITAKNYKKAEKYCKDHLGYCEVVGEYINKEVLVTMDE